MILNDPIPILFEIFSKLYENADKIEVWYADDEFIKSDDEEQGQGVTVFPDDGSEPVIYVSTSLTIKYLPEILAHEMAHVIAGYIEGHGDVWNEAFDKINAMYNGIIENKELEYDDV